MMEIRYALGKTHARQLTLNESVLRTSVLSSNDEGRTRGNGSGPLTIPQPVKHREEVDASMPTRSGSVHPASTSSDQAPPTDPVRLRDCFVDVLAEIAGREKTRDELIFTVDPDKSEED